MVRLVVLISASLLLGCRAARDPEDVYNQVELSFERGDLDAAGSAADRAIIQYHAQPEWGWRFRISKARVLVYKSAWAEALSLLQEDPPPSLAGTDIAVRRPMVQGMAYRVAQDFNKSAAMLASAQELATTTQPSLLCEVLNAKASLEVSQNRYPEGEATYSQALALAQQYHRPYQEAAARVGLAWVASRLERFDEAIDRGQAAYELSRSRQMKGMAATALGNLGSSYFQLGDFETAVERYKTGAETSKRSGLTGYSAYWYTGVVNSYLAVRDFAAAESLAKSTLESARALKNIQTTTECLNDLTRIALRTNRVADAQRYSREALKSPDKFGKLDSLILAAEIAAIQKRFSEADQLFHKVLDEPTVETPLRWEAQAGLAGVRDSEGKPLEAEQLYKQAINTIETARHSINHDELRLSFLSSGIGVYGDYVDFLIRHGRPDDALRQADLSRARTLAEGLSSNHVASSEPAFRLKPQQLAQRLHSTVLVYWLGEKHSYLWAIAPAKTEYFALPPASEIDPLIKNYRDLTLKSSDILATASDAGQKLYSTLVAPAKKLIPDGSRVILLPDASLYGLNFETLIVPGPQPHFWIEDVTLTTASSLSVLDGAGNRSSAKPKNLLLVGDAVPVPEFGDLPQAPAEIQKLSQYFPGKRGTILHGPQATPTAYLSSSPGRFSYIHFVTHGTASRARPLESAVILSREPGADSYKLYARDIVAHPLHADLVTISACNGSGTRAYSGEGLVGLSWAFLRAGAHNVIGALWEVSDVSTPQLMDKMYAELAAGKDPATALRNAKLSFLHQRNVFAKPFYWAPFQLYSGS